jgi:glycosyltransferase involved in cell wall biosynthesis
MEHRGEYKYALVTVIIPSYNRFPSLLRAIASIQAQTWSEVEIIVVNDGSTDRTYYDHAWSTMPRVTVVHLDVNTRQRFGYACAAYVRNQGIDRARGAYVAFCDDDDIWLPHKLERQMAAMQATGCAMSSTDGYIGRGPYLPSSTYRRYNAEHFFPQLQHIYRRTEFLKAGFPAVWDIAFMRVHNCMICSSVVIEKRLLDTIGGFRIMPPPGEDYDCWLRALAFTRSAYVDEPCFYYDDAHADGQQWN